MEFTPLLTPGRTDQLGHMQVPHDVFVHVTQTDGWIDTIDTHQPASRRPYLEAIAYWMNVNGACIIRSGSTSKFAAIKDISYCSTILYGRQNVEGNSSFPPMPDKVASFSISATPLTGTLPLLVTLTITVNADNTADLFSVDWGDGTPASTRPALPGTSFDVTHTYALGTGPSKVISVQALDGDEDPVGAPQTKTVTLN